MQGGHYYPGVGGYVAGGHGYVVGVGYPRTVGAEAPAPPHAMAPPGSALIRVGPEHPLHPHNRHHHMRQHHFPEPPPEGPMHGYPIQRPPWRDMNAPGSPPLGEGHVPMPLTPEGFNGTWGYTSNGGAPPGVVITFSARPQKPFKTSRLLVSGTKVGSSAVGRLIGQTFVGTDLQQGELGFMDLETMGAGGSFDTWVSFKQAEPGVWIRVQATLTAFPTGNDFEVYTVTGMGHYLH